MITVFLKFADKPTATAAALSIMAGAGVDASADALPMMGYTDDGTRFDLALVGGDGVYRQQFGTETRVIYGFGEVDVPVFVEQPGFFVNMLWHGDEATVPDFGAARIHPSTPSQVFAV